MSFKNLNFIVLSSLLFVTACNQKSEFYENALESPLETRVVTPPPPTGTSPILNPRDEIADKDQENPAGENPVVSNPGTPVVNNPGTPVVNNPGTPAVNNPGTPGVNNPGNPVVNNPGKEQPVGEEPVGEAPVGDSPVQAISEKSCRYIFGATKVGSNVKVTVISGSINKLKTLDHVEFQRLSSENKSFFSNILNNRLDGIPQVSSKNKNTLSDSDRLIIKNANEASARFTKIDNNISLNYYLQGKNASFRGTSLHSGSQLFLVLSAEENASVDFTSIHDGSEVFVIFLSEKENVTCVSVTGVDGRIASYVYGNIGHATQGQIRGTGFDEASSIVHHVIGGDNTLSSFKGTSVKESLVDFKTIGGDKTHTTVQFTSLHENNNFNFNIKGKDDTLLRVNGTNAGKDALVNLSITGQEDTSASFRFTNEQNIRINGEITAKDPELNLLGKLDNSTSAKINVNLIKN